MQSDLRRIIAVEAHRRTSGRCPVRSHSLGTGETFDIRPVADGFTDMESGLTARGGEDKILLSGHEPISLRFSGDVGFDGFEPQSREFFSGRAGGGASVTLYDAHSVDYFQYAVLAEGDRS